MELYFNWNAVCALKVVLCLAEKGVDWTPRHIVLGKFEQLEPGYLAINPAGVVPALVHDGHVILESSVILEYLEDAFPDFALRPAAAADRARMRWWMRQVDDIVHPSVRPISFARFVAPRAKALSEAERAAMLSRTPKKEIADLWDRAAGAPFSDEEIGRYLTSIRKVLISMEEQLRGSRWLAGDMLSLGDIAMAPYFRRFEQLGVTSLWSELPAVSSWWQQMRARPAYAALDRLRLQYAPADHPAA
ncbi:glutathione S-transferase family protein [Sphingomonas canadensis]|uniref:Glutathione S-transferase family protein n=1 Tax=Sphingomonas canadensis TaxID=1219257 RepID=A0ABW3H7E7_9SPHN|nr:glutathione S-transferase family protein [Sphingomonas canadensis]MCW3834529.1 glutathione S-transferase family protein [Sphingomonas canadensis]